MMTLTGALFRRPVALGAVKGVERVETQGTWLPMEDVWIDQPLSSKLTLFLFYEGIRRNSRRTTSITRGNIVTWTYAQ